MPACAGGARRLSGPAGAPHAPCAIGNARFAPPTIDDIVAETRETYDGPLAVGEDLMTFEIGERVAVRRRVA